MYMDIYICVQNLCAGVGVYILMPTMYVTNTNPIYIFPLLKTFKDTQHSTSRKTKNKNKNPNINKQPGHKKMSVPQTTK